MLIAIGSVVLTVFVAGCQNLQKTGEEGEGGSKEGVYMLWRNCKFKINTILCDIYVMQLLFKTYYIFPILNNI